MGKSGVAMLWAVGIRPFVSARSAARWSAAHLGVLVIWLSGPLSQRAGESLLSGGARKGVDSSMELRAPAARGRGATRLAVACASCLPSCGEMSRPPAGPAGSACFHVLVLLRPGVMWPDAGSPRDRLASTASEAERARRRDSRDVRQPS